MDHRGSWRLMVVEVNADWQQRIVITGAAAELIVPGLLGHVVTISGTGADPWRMRFEHDRGDGWRPNERVVYEPPRRQGNRTTRLIRSKDHDWPDDRVPNDMVVYLDGAYVRVFLGTPRGVRPPAPVEALVATRGEWILGVDAHNLGPQPLVYDLALAVSDAGRAALATCGVVPGAREVAGQEVVDGAVCLPPLVEGGMFTANFLMRSDGTGIHLPAVEFELRELTGGTVLSRQTIPASPALTSKSRLASPRPGQLAVPTRLSAATAGEHDEIGNGGSHQRWRR
jgi:hypothetical protein